MSSLSYNNIAEAIYLGAKDKTGGEQTSFYKKVVHFLVKKKLLSKTAGILEALNKITNKYENKIVAKVSSAKKLDQNTNKELTSMLTRRYRAASVDLEERLNESLLGGFRIEVDDEVIDLTIKNKIKQLQAHLT